MLSLAYGVLFSIIAEIKSNKTGSLSITDPVLSAKLKETGKCDKPQLPESLIFTNNAERSF